MTAANKKRTETRIRILLNSIINFDRLILRDIVSVENSKLNVFVRKFRDLYIVDSQ